MALFSTSDLTIVISFFSLTIRTIKTYYLRNIFIRTRVFVYLGHFDRLWVESPIVVLTLKFSVNRECETDV